MFDFQPTPEMKREGVGSKTKKCTFVGYRVLHEGIWSGDCLLAEVDTLVNDIDAAPYPRGKVRAHRTKEV